MRNNIIITFQQLSYICIIPLCSFDNFTSANNTKHPGWKGVEILSFDHYGTRGLGSGSLHPQSHVLIDSLGNTSSRRRLETKGSLCTSCAKRAFGAVSWPNGMHDVSTIHDAFCGITFSANGNPLYAYMYIQMHTGGKAISFQPASHNITIDAWRSLKKKYLCWVKQKLIYWR